MSGVRAIEGGIENIYIKEATDNTGNNKGEGDNGQTEGTLPDFGPGLIHFFTITSGSDEGETGENNLDQKSDAGDSGGKFKDIIKKEKKATTGLGVVEVRIAGERVSDFTKNTCHHFRILG